MEKLTTRGGELATMFGPQDADGDGEDDEEPDEEDDDEENDEDDDFTNPKPARWTTSRIGDGGTGSRQRILLSRNAFRLDESCWPATGMDAPAPGNR